MSWNSTTGPDWIQYGGPCGSSEVTTVAIDPAKPPVRDYCAEMRAQIAAIDAQAQEDIAQLGYVREVLDRRDHAIRIVYTQFGKQSPRAIRSAPPSRVDERKAIDAMLVEDARRTPAFAAARKAAVVAAADHWETIDAAHIIRDFHGYEERRGGFAKPAPGAEVVDSCRTLEPFMVRAYERARGMK